MISRGPFQPLQVCDSPFCEGKTCSSQLLSSMLWDDIGYLLLKHPYGSHPNITSLTTLQQHMRRAPDWHISGGPVATSSHRCPICLHIYSHAPMQQASLISCPLCGKETATGWLNSKKTNNMDICHEWYYRISNLYLKNYTWNLAALSTFSRQPWK